MAATQTMPVSTVRSTEASGQIHSIGIAGIKVVRAPDRIKTVLGSCIGVALYDRESKIGGMCHVILPDSREGAGDPAKFADTAVDLLLHELVVAGAKKDKLLAKIGGGASMFGEASAAGLGTRNADSVRARLHHHSIKLVAAAVGGTKGRRMVLDPATGEVQVVIIGEEAQNL
ncbi:MAG: chemotaxis protein CheD [Planctomycetota bacterium]